MDVEVIPVAELHEDPANVRVHPSKNIEAIRASLARFGQQKPILVDAGNVVRAGNGTLQAARSLGWYSLRCVRTDLAGSEAVAYAIADNRTSELAEWNDADLARTLAALRDEGFETEATGFDDGEIDALLASLADEEAGEPTPDPGAQTDHAAELQAQWQVHRGDLWLIPSVAAQGKAHRLLCGDATRPEDVARVMDGMKAVLMNTDPPYGVDYNPKASQEANADALGIETHYRTFDRVENDDLTGAELQSFLEATIRVAVPHLRPDAAFYLWHPMLTQGTFFAAAAAAADILIHRQIIWAKPHFIFGRGDYHWQHELCFYGWVRGNRPPFYGERNQSTLWTLDEGGGLIRKDQGHPTQKPVELFARPIANHTRRGEVVYEPFAGSGSQFVAAEQAGRLCHGLELMPKYCAVTLQRLADMGLEPERA